MRSILHHEKVILHKRLSVCSFAFWEPDCSFTVISFFVCYYVKHEIITFIKLESKSLSDCFGCIMISVFIIWFYSCGSNGKKYGEKWPTITWHVLQFTCSRLFALGMTIFGFWLNCNSRNWLCSDQIRRAGDFFFSWLICFSILDSDSVFLFQIKKFRANWPTSVHFIKWLCLSFWKWNAKINS